MVKILKVFISDQLNLTSLQFLVLYLMQYYTNGTKYGAKINVHVYCSSLLPELTVDGLIRLLHHIETDIDSGKPGAEYYTSPLVNTEEKIDLIQSVLHIFLCEFLNVYCYLLMLMKHVSCQRCTSILY
jgi:hypothetical protein